MNPAQPVYSNTSVWRSLGSSVWTRVWESHESGYPHIHVAVVFKDKTFVGGHMGGKFRVKGKDFSTLKGSWKYGYSDFVLCNSVKGAFKYAGKYLMKGISVEEVGSKAVKGLAMRWIFRKRSFSLSGSLAKLYHDEIQRYSNSTKVLLAYKRLDDSEVLLLFTRWRVLGFMEREAVRWRSFQRISNGQMAEIMDKTGFRLKELR